MEEKFNAVSGSPTEIATNVLPQSEVLPSSSPRIHRNDSFGGIFRLKPSDVRPSSLKRTLGWQQLITIGIGSTIGAGVYVLVGTAARERAGPALTISFLIAGIAAAMAALCYAELSSRCPSAGSAYAYAYTCVGEVVAWLIGWALILEYTVGGAAVARGISPNLVVLFGGSKYVPFGLARIHIPYLGVELDLVAGFVVIFVTYLLCRGIEESVFVQKCMTLANCGVLLFVIFAGCWAGYSHGWPGYEQPNGFMPFGINGVVGGAAMVFFAYIGFDSVASTAEEVKNPQRDLPLGIGLSLLACGILYMAIAAVLVGIVPYYDMDPDTPMSKAFAFMGMPWAMLITAAGALAALSTTLLGSLLPQPRILMAMARDGLLPEWFAKVNSSTKVPQNSTILTGVVAATMAALMDIDQLSGMVSVGTLLAFTTVSVSILIVRYMPPVAVPLPPRPRPSYRHPRPKPPLPRPVPSRRSSTNLAEANTPASYQSPSSYFSPQLSSYSPSFVESIFGTPPAKPSPLGMSSDAESDGELGLGPSVLVVPAEIEEVRQQQQSPVVATDDAKAVLVTMKTPLLPLSSGEESTHICKSKRGACTCSQRHTPSRTHMSEEVSSRRTIALVGIAAVIVGSVISVLMAAANPFTDLVRVSGASAGSVILLCGFIILLIVKQDDAQSNFGHSDGFQCPLVPALPILSILVNTYLMVNLGLGTWLRTGTWLILGAAWYAGYGRHHSILHKTYKGKFLAGLRTRSWLDLTRISTLRNHNNLS